jgi:dihydroflavonol-4-reductase
MLREGGSALPESLSFFTADLTADEGWRAAVTGCDYVLHVASPLSTRVPKDENEMIVPARDGTLRVLRAARDAGVRRVVVTSSMGAIGYGHPPREQPFDETEWTNLDGADVQPYVKSKTLAERAAWDFIAREGGGLELSVINPAAIFGPVLGPDFSGSIEIVKSLLDGATPAVPRVYFGVVDVRDVADLHLRAMTRRRRKANASSRSPARRCRSSTLPKYCGGNWEPKRAGFRGSRLRTGWCGSPRTGFPCCRRSCRCSEGCGIPPAPRRDRCSAGRRVPTTKRSSPLPKA